MINLFDEQGQSLRPDPARRSPLGPRIAHRMRNYGTRYFVPFSSMHRYQRTDSAWAREHTTKLTDYPASFESRGDDILPAFVRYDCLKDSVTEIAPAERPDITVPPETFGDDWSEPLSAEEHRQVDTYFQSFLHLRTFLDFVNVRVGGQDHVVDLAPGGFGRGLTFEVPRQSLLTSIRYGLFDDLLIGNFMRTVFHGRWTQPSLYPGDNARAKTPEALQRYFRAYRDRAPLEYFRHQLSHRLHRVFEDGAIKLFRSLVPFDSSAYRLVKRVYRAVKRPQLT